ncbi:MAG: 3-isopropylmalate dehydratase small subunit [Chloroflexota bacterium]|nr:3-isopropylmalate dehydratase small subunit [Chloroflexota bacterium]NOG63913.1 3-isopropylmalate dehydratase small subunit [Chloroflexota bacterium]GIK64023.1 MAG: 3-isopropylmalate dehydratase small subunit [Chloroflexota bacterium]
MEPLKPFSASLVPLPIENIDTDQIIPARYLKVTDKNSLAEGCFTDWRQDPEFVLNNPRYQNGHILVAGHNFGCGSSREHAPWALKAYGFQAVISTYFADIFRNNSLKNGLLPIIVDAETHQALLDLAEEAPEAEVHIDLASQTVTLPNGQKASFPIDPFSKTCLLEGIDELGYLMKQTPEIEAFEASHPPRVQTVLAGR